MKGIYFPLFPKLHHRFVAQRCPTLPWADQRGRKLCWCHRRFSPSRSDGNLGVNSPRRLCPGLALCARDRSSPWPVGCDKQQEMSGVSQRPRGRGRGHPWTKGSVAPSRSRVRVAAVLQNPGHEEGDGPAEGVRGWYPANTALGWL